MCQNPYPFGQTPTGRKALRPIVCELEWWYKGNYGHILTSDLIGLMYRLKQHISDQYGIMLTIYRPISPLSFWQKLLTTMVTWRNVFWYYKFVLSAGVSRKGVMQSGFLFNGFWAFLIFGLIFVVLAVYYEGRRSVSHTLLRYYY